MKLSATSFLESLEPRLFLDSTFARVTSRGTLLIQGTRASETIRVQPGIVVIRNHDIVFAADSPTVKRMYIDAVAGNDRIVITAKLRATILGGSGDDTLIGSSASDSLDGGDGLDTVDYTSRTESIVAEIDIDNETAEATGSGGQANEHDTYHSVETILSGSGDDQLAVIGGSLIGGPHFGPYLIDGGAGDDHLDNVSLGEGDGDDAAAVTLLGGEGNDAFGWNSTVTPTLLGGAGDDSFDFGDVDGTNASIDGGPGIDSETFDGTDETYRTVDPNVEDFSVTNGEADASIQANDLGDTIEVDMSASFHVAVTGGVGNDQITVNYPASSGDGLNYALVDVDGGAGNDRVQVSGATASIKGGGGKDTLIGGEYADVLSGGNGNDKPGLAMAATTLSWAGRGVIRSPTRKGAMSTLSLGEGWG